MSRRIESWEFSLAESETSQVAMPPVYRKGQGHQISIGAAGAHVSTKHHDTKGGGHFDSVEASGVSVGGLTALDLMDASPSSVTRNDDERHIRCPSRLVALSQVRKQ